MIGSKHSFSKRFRLFPGQSHVKQIAMVEDGRAFSKPCLHRLKQDGSARLDPVDFNMQSPCGYSSPHNRRALLHCPGTMPS